MYLSYDFLASTIAKLDRFKRTKGVYESNRKLRQILFDETRANNVVNDVRIFIHKQEDIIPDIGPSDDYVEITGKTYKNKNNENILIPNNISSFNIKNGYIIMSNNKSSYMFNYGRRNSKITTYRNKYALLKVDLVFTEDYKMGILELTNKNMMNIYLGKSTINFKNVILFSVNDSDLDLSKRFDVAFIDKNMKLNLYNIINKKTETFDIPDNFNPVKIVSNHDGIMILSDKGRVLIYGNNDNERLGYADLYDEYSSTFIPELIFIINHGIIDLDLSKFHSIMVNSRNAIIQNGIIRHSEFYKDVNDVVESVIAGEDYDLYINSDSNLLMSNLVFLINNEYINLTLPFALNNVLESQIDRFDYKRTSLIMVKS